MIINEYHFLGVAKLLRRDCDMNADTGVRLPTEGKELNIRESLRKDPGKVP